MNCHDLEAVIDDLARGQMMDAGAREKALAHTASCAGCSTRLADERALSAGLRQLDRATTSEVTGKVEESLLVVFSAEHSAKPLPRVAGARLTARRLLYVAGSVAAVIVVVLLLSLAVSRTRVSQTAPQQAGLTNPPAATDPPRTSVQPASSADKREQRTQATIKSSRRERSARRGDDAATSSRGAENASGSSDDVEIATDFIPLIGRDSLGQFDSGQVVRVELPRTALMSLGLPMNMERADERIKADVVVGNDGMARAIRFVR